MKRRGKRLVERVDLGRISAQRVDRAARTIYRVKILGFASENGRRYLREGVEKAKRLYEGAKVRVNHPKKPGEQRDVGDTLGWFENVTIDAEGMWADLHTLLSPEQDRTTALLYEAAERRPDLMGFSHNVQGDTEDGPDGVEIVHAITEVRSVDLVADPATTSGLFEGRGGRPVKFRAFLEAIFPPKKASKIKGLKRLLEMGMMDQDMPLDTTMPEEGDEGPEGHEEALKGGFEASINALVSQCLSGELDCKQGIKKIGELIRTHNKLSGGAGGDEPVEEDEDEDLEEEEDEDEKGMKYKKEALLYRAERKGRALCEEMGVVPDAALTEALSWAPDEKAMKRLIEREKARGGQVTTPAPKPQPRSGSTGSGKKGLTESTNGQPNDDLADFIHTLRA